MKINSNENHINTANAVQIKKTPAFRAGGYTGALSAAGNVQQLIENQGFWLLFVIQDFLGMTCPRVGAGFLRDKEVTGQYNIQEGFEVLGREGLTGPCMMAVAPLGLALAAKFGRSTSVNTRLIKRFGDRLKNMVSKPDFDKRLLGDKDKFKKTFYRENITTILQDTLGKNNVKDKDINFVLEEISKYENIPSNAKTSKFMGKSKYRNERMNNIIEYIDNIRYSTSSNLNEIQKLKIDNTLFSIKDSIDGIIKYSDDAIRLNKKLDKLDAQMAENIKDSSIAKRLITNVALMASTLGMLFILPKIYAKGKVPPGAQTAQILKERAALSENQQSDTELSNESGDISFKGKQPPLSKLGKILSKIYGEKYASELEYNGHNFTDTIMASLSVFGLLVPRGWHAYQRAPKDENGKKDLTEIWEICIRDLISSLSVVFAVPMLTRACVSSYEDKSGYVLMQRDRSLSKSKKILDLFNPYSKAHVMKVSELNSIYNAVDSKEKMINFCKYIDNNNGDLQKILLKSSNSEDLFNADTLDLKSLKELPKKEKNKRILSFFEKLENNKTTDELITKLMKGANKAAKNNKIASIARGLNSVPGLITTFLISPVILGWFIPRLTYANTRRLHAKAEKEHQSKVNTAA